MKLEIAIVGIGNCASSLLQGISLYTHQPTDQQIGLMHSKIAEISCADIEIVAAFDIDKRKVGKSISEAILAKPNCVPQYSEHEICGGDTVVSMGSVLDGCAAHMEEYPEEHAFRVLDLPPSNVVETLRKSGAKVLVSYLPVGSERATRHYAQACLDAGVAFVNCAPCFIASDEEWAQKFREANIPIVGDDIKSQVGATIVHRMLSRLFGDRGVRLKRTYQLNTGGNTDFLNMLDKDRLKSKKISKTQAVTSQLKNGIKSESIHIGPSDYVPWQGDNKVCFLRMEGEGFAGQPIELEMRLSVQDSPNSAGIVVDAIRCAALAQTKGIGGPIDAACSWFMKSPPQQLPDYVAHERLEAFISQE